MVPHRPLSPWRPLAFVAVFLLALPVGIGLERSGLLRWSRSGQPGDSFLESWRLVQDHFVDRKAVDSEHMTQGAIRGMLSSLGDEGHTGYLTRQEYEQMQSDLKGRGLEGIGARMTIRQHQPTVAGVVRGSPAEKAGLHPGDVFLQVDGKDLTDLPLDRIVTMVRGKAGEPVHLKIARDGASGPLEFDIRRAHIDVPDVSWHMLPGVPIAHIAIQTFGDQADKQLRTALAEAKEQGAKGLILDVRGNLGGLKDQAVAVTSEFLDQGDVFIEQDSRGRQTHVPVTLGGTATDIPVCVLIDQGTASSAEIFAGALQDHGRGQLIGTKTFGTGTVLLPYPLRDRSVVLLAVAEWLTPNGRQIWHKGITPDVELALPADARLLLPEDSGNLDAAGLARSEDKQLLKALQVLKERLP